MFQIRPATNADREQVVALLVRLQAAPCHHIGFHGGTPAELAEELVDLGYPGATTVATDDSGGIRGVLSVDVDTTLRRAWWYGPFVDVPAEHPAADRIWSRTADLLYAAAREAVHGVDDTELYGHVEHRRLAAFAARQGFPAGEYSSVLRCAGVDVVRMIGAVTDRDDVDVTDLPRPPTDCSLVAAFIRLHERCFPNTYLSAAAALAGGTEHTVVAATEGGRLVGYAIGSVQPADYYIDYVAVQPECRQRGIGTALVTTLVQRLADVYGARPAACAVVAGGNAPSRQLLRTLGFVPHLELVSYRRHATSLVA